jgi:hypothetical protein
VRDIAIGGGFAIGYALKCRPHRLLKWCAPQVMHRKIKLFQCAAEKGKPLLMGLSEQTVLVITLPRLHVGQVRLVVKPATYVAAKITSPSGEG